MEEQQGERTKVGGDLGVGSVCTEECQLASELEQRPCQLQQPLREAATPLSRSRQARDSR